MDLDIVELSPALNNHVVVNKICEEIVRRVQSMPQYEKLGRNIDLVLYVCNLIEELVYTNNVKNQPKDYKKELAWRIFEFLRFNKPEDKDFLYNSIDFLWSSERIKKVKFSRRIVKYFKNFITKNEGK